MENYPWPDMSWLQLEWLTESADWVPKTPFNKNFKKIILVMDYKYFFLAVLTSPDLKRYLPIVSSFDLIDISDT